MSAFGIRFAITEYDAAQALLDLQSNIRDTEHERHDREESVENAKLLFSCTIASNVAKQPIKTVPSPKVGTKTPMFAVGKNTTRKSDVATTHSSKRKTQRDQDLTRDRHNRTYHGEESCNKRSKIIKKKPTEHVTVTAAPAVSRVSNTAKKHKMTNDSNTTVKTRDVGTQTEDKDQLPKIETMEFTITKLYEKLKSLQEQLKSNSQRTETTEQDVLENDEEFYDDDDDESYKVDPRVMLMDHNDASDPDMDETFTERETPKKVKPKHNADQYNGYNNNAKVLSNRNVTANADDLVPIGDGNALIPSRIFRHINWISYTSATRKLLTAVFTRRVLATHSLTGKPSPAFPNKPAKKKLDPALVNDIVQTVVERCCVPENVVRTAITTKCADESKMLRTRENIINKRKHKVKRENIPPESDSEEF